MLRSKARNVGIAVAIAGGVMAVGAAIAGCGTTGTSGPPGMVPRTASPGIGGSSYSYYRSMMASYGDSSMMGGASYGWMMGTSGYRWMTGAGGVPGWMRGERLPGFMMRGGTDPGKIMGRFWANSPGPRISPAQAAKRGGQIPAGARVNHAANVITFATTDVRIVALASPVGGPDETFRIAGLVNPRLVVPRGARVVIQVINADPDTAHGLVITTGAATGSWMPMMTARPAFSGSALWFLGNPTGAGLHTGVVSFTAATPGSYRYLCPVPGHEQEGMAGTFTVTGSAR